MSLKVIVFGATGGLGQRVWKMAVAKGHDVVAFVRSPGKLDQSDPGFSKLEVIKGDVMDADSVRQAAENCEIAVNCTSPAGGNATIDLAKQVVGNAKAAGVKKFYMVGGLGALYVPGSEKGQLMQDWEDAEAMAKYGLSTKMPKEVIQRMTAGHLLSMKYMEELGVPHTFLCPGMMKEGEGSAAPVVTLDEVGGSSPMVVKLASVAKVIVDDFEVGSLLGHRVCVSES